MTMLPLMRKKSRKSRQATRSELAQIFRLLDQHCKKTPAGLAEYDEGWSDEVLARAIANDMPTQAVAHCRAEVVGKLFKMPERIVGGPKLKREPGPLRKDVEALKAQLADMQRQLEALRLAHNGIVGELVRSFDDRFASYASVERRAVNGEAA